MSSLAFAFASLYLTIVFGFYALKEESDKGLVAGFIGAGISGLFFHIFISSLIK